MEHIWNMEIQPVALPLPDLLCSTPLLQDPGLAGWLSYLTPSSIINIINLQLSFLCSVDESCSAAKKILGTFYRYTGFVSALGETKCGGDRVHPGPGQIVQIVFLDKMLERFPTPPSVLLLLCS